MGMRKHKFTALSLVAMFMAILFWGLFAFVSPVFIIPACVMNACQVLLILSYYFPLT